MTSPKLNAIPLSGPEAEEVAAEAVRLLSERAEVVLNAVDEGIYCLDSRGRTTFVNEAATRMLGYTLREMIGKPQHELIHYRYGDGSHFPVEACPIYSSATEGIHQRVGGDVFWRKDGTALPVAYTSVPIREGRRVVAVVVTFRDMTTEQEARRQLERLAAERAAREEAERGRAALMPSEERFRALIAATGQIVWTNSPDGRMTGAQPGWSAFTGQSEAEYEGFGWANAVHPEDGPPTIEAWNAAVASRSMFVFEHRVRRHDGVYRRFAIRAVPLLNADGTIREWVGSHTDVTEQRELLESRARALAEVERARAEFELALAQTPAAIATLEGPTHIVRTANPAFFQLIGQRKVLGLPFREAFPELEGQPFFDLLDGVFNSGQPFRGERVQVKYDRQGNGTLEEAVFNVEYKPLKDRSGNCTGILIHAVEVTI
jgi:PAS domain S-box-containing protein